MSIRGRISSINRVWIVLILLLGVNFSLFGFTSDELMPSVVDVRSVGMGYTGSVSSIGSNAIFHNPALLAEVDIPEFQAGGRFFFGFVQNNWLWDYVTKFQPLPIITHISGSFPVRFRLFKKFELAVVPAVGYHVYLDFTRRWNSFEELDESLTDYDQESMRGGFDAISPAIAFQFLDKYSIGIAYNFGGITPLKSYYSSTGEFDLYEEDTIDYTEYWEYYDNMKFYARGSFYQIGGFIEPVPWLALGVSYISPLDWKWEYGETHVNFTDIMWNPCYERWDTTFLDTTYYFSDEDAYYIPGILTIGIRSKILPRLILAGEFQLHPFSKVQEYGEDLGINDGYALRFGMEFETPVLIRGGYYRESIPRTNYDEDTPRPLNGVTLGLSVPISSMIELEGCFEYAFWRGAGFEGRYYYYEHLFRASSSIKLRLPE